MTLDELQAIYDEGKKMIRKERYMRMHVFRFDDATRKQKVAEIDRLARLWAAMKDAAKLGCAPQVEEQPRLLDVPRKDAYR